MRTVCITSLLAVVCAGIVLAAPIDGKWFSEQKIERDGNTFKITRTFELKAEGEKLTGTVTVALGDMEPRKMEIKDGKFAGGKFSFSVTMSTPNGEFKRLYAGTVEGDTLKATSSSDDGGDSVPFEAKRQ